jgi:hypothetical protein
MMPSALEPVTGPAAWRGADIAESDAWIYHLSDAERGELETVGARFLEADPDLRFVQASEFPLPATAPGLQAWADGMERGHGFMLVRGLHCDLYSDALSSAIFYVLGLHLGDPMRQNQLGDAFDHVRAITSNSGALGSRKAGRLPFHSDSSDVVALMCLRGAREGGRSILLSGATIYNEVLARRPDLAPLLFADWYWDWHRQDPDAPENVYVSPMASQVDGVFSMYAGSGAIYSAQDYPEVPRLTAEQSELLALIEEICLLPGLPLEMDFRPGDMQWLSNYTALHSRTAYLDFDQPELKRHLLRLWLKREGRPLVPRFGKHGIKPRGDVDDAIPEATARFRISQICYPRYDWGVATA